MVLFLFDETVANGRNGSQNPRVRTRCGVEVADNNGVPEIRIGPEGEAHDDWTAKFADRAQFERFAEAVESLRSRLKGVHERRATRT